MKKPTKTVRRYIFYLEYRAKNLKEAKQKMNDDIQKLADSGDMLWADDYKVIHLTEHEF